MRSFFFSLLFICGLFFSLWSCGDSPNDPADPLSSSDDTNSSEGSFHEISSANSSSSFEAVNHSSSIVSSVSSSSSFEVVNRSSSIVSSVNSSSSFEVVNRSSSLVSSAHSSSSSPLSSSAGSSNSVVQSSSSDLKKDVLTDIRDGHTYTTAVFGDQIWMTENLNYSASGSWCYNDSTSNCDRYGRLYTWATAMDIDAQYDTVEWTGSDEKHQGICPEGWFLPSEDDWLDFTSYITDAKQMYVNSGLWEIGSYLKTTSGWLYFENGTDEFGFSALPSGYRMDNGFFESKGFEGLWWSSTQNSNRGVYRRLANSDDYWHENFQNKLYGLSIRCLQNK